MSLATTATRTGARSRLPTPTRGGQWVPYAGDLETYSADVIGRAMRDYQIEAARAVVHHALNRTGETLVVMFARQMGKNELSAQCEGYLLDLHGASGATMVKAAPTFRPQLHVSLARLRASLHAKRYQGAVRGAHGYRLGLGRAEIAFLSAAPHAHVAGATASLLLEVDEAQDVDADKYQRDLRPMVSSTSAATVLYGTAWAPDSLLEVQRAANDALTAKDGIRRNFICDWTVGAAANPAYRRFVEAEIARLGEAHPLIRTQYLLQHADGAGAFFNAETLALMRGTHVREDAPADLRDTYVAGVDVAGGVDADQGLAAADDRRDATVVTIAKVTAVADGGHPVARVVQCYRWQNRPLHEQYERLVRLLRDTWHVRRACVDASGVGADLAARLARALGSVIEPVAFSVQSKSRLAYGVMAHAAAGRLSWWSEDGRSPEYAQAWRELTAVRPVLRSGNMLGWDAPRSVGHDDHVASLALCSWAAQVAAPVATQVMTRRTPARGARGAVQSEGRF